MSTEIQETINRLLRRRGGTSPKSQKNRGTGNQLMNALQEYIDNHRETGDIEQPPAGILATIKTNLKAIFKK